jgi:hypothetical protein
MNRVNMMYPSTLAVLMQSSPSRELTLAFMHSGMGEQGGRTLATRLDALAVTASRIGHILQAIVEQVQAQYGEGNNPQGRLLISRAGIEDIT